jgi:hypothetical protein
MINDHDLNKRLMELFAETEEVNEEPKNCGCGKEVCETYGVQEVEEAPAQESYSPGDEYEEGMVSNCCGAPIIGVVDGTGRCSECKEMASAEVETDEAIEIEPETSEAPCGMEPELELAPDTEQTGGSVTFRQEKNTDKGSVSIEASADDMQELAKVLKLAGITLPQGINPEQPEQPEAEVEVDADDGSHPTMDFPHTDVDANMSTDKAVLTSVIRDKLRDYLKNSRS